jgi:hypothetical protein
MVEDEVLHGFSGLYGRTIYAFLENFRDGGGAAMW